MTYAPQSYLDAPDYVRRAVCNGCGTAGWKGKLVPDNILGLDITEDCDIHDWMYFEGETEEDKIFADQKFRLNLYARIRKASWWLRFLRYRLARKYYLAVVIAGGPAFWEGKE